MCERLGALLVHWSIVSILENEVIFSNIVHMSCEISRFRHEYIFVPAPLLSHFPFVFNNLCKSLAISIVSYHQEQWTKTYLFIRILLVIFFFHFNDNIISDKLHLSILLSNKTKAINFSETRIDFAPLPLKKWRPRPLLVWHALRADSAQKK